MELYATGFNAWNQLGFRENDPRSNDEPSDLRAFTCILRDSEIRNVEAFLTYTSVDTSSGDATAGIVPDEHVILRRLRREDSRHGSCWAEASNGMFVIVNTQDFSLEQYPSLKNMRFMDGMLLDADDYAKRIFKVGSIDHPIQQLLAYETGFVCLTADGMVYTWGDERYALCLGRPVSPESPANKPGLVTDLVNLPTGRIVKVAANGYLVAALTSGNDLYCWGGHPAREPIMEGLSCGCPYPIDLGDHDIIDVGVGESHMIALTANGQIYVIGDNQDGQLGLDIQPRARDWAKVDLGLHERQKIKGVAAGPRNSFIVVEGLRP